MVKPKINFGDKIFIYGQFMNMDMWYEWGIDNPSYNSVMGYVANGGFIVKPRKSRTPGDCLPGFVMDFLQGASLAVPTAFSELVDVTDLLSLSVPVTLGTKIWMPVPNKLPL